MVRSLADRTFQLRLEADDAPAIPVRPDPTGTERIWARYKFRFGYYLADLQAEQALPEHLRTSRA